MRYREVQLRVRFCAAAAWTRTISFMIPYCIYVVAFASSFASEALLGVSGSANAHIAIAVRGGTVILIMACDNKSGTNVWQRRCEKRFDMVFFFKRGDINVPDAVRCAWHATRHARLTGGRAVLCADRMDGGLEDPGRHDGEQRGGRLVCEHGRA
jgi:hypothetical protein